MTSEDKLPDELLKLEIAPQATLRDNNLSLAHNPFYNESVKHSSSESCAQSLSSSTTAQTERKNVRHPSCRKCRVRRSSESVLDEFKVLAQLDADIHIANMSPGTRCTPPVHRQSFKKSCLGKGNRKFLLKEPVLRALQTCIHPQNNIRRKLLTALIVNDQSSGGSSTRTSEICNVSSSSLVKESSSNFNDLIEECQTLLEQNVDFGERVGELHQYGKPRNIQISHPKYKISQYSDANGAVGSSHFPLQNITPPSTVPAEFMNVASRASTCSQQAGNGACDDVTIDELASYFDTLVHIPKKMSSMAEMMYI